MRVARFDWRDEIFLTGGLASRPRNYSTQFRRKAVCALRYFWSCAWVMGVVHRGSLSLFLKGSGWGRSPREEPQKIQVPPYRSTKSAAVGAMVVAAAATAASNARVHLRRHERPSATKEKAATSLPSACLYDRNTGRDKKKKARATSPSRLHQLLQATVAATKNKPSS